MMLIALQCGKEWTNRLLAAARDMPWCQLATSFVQAPCAVIRDGLADTSVSLYPQNKDIPLFFISSREAPAPADSHAEYVFSPNVTAQGVLRHIGALLADPSGQLLPEKQRLREMISLSLEKLGIGSHLLAHRYLQEGVVFLFDTPYPGRIRLMAKLHEHLAQCFDTSPVMVDRAIRHGVEVCWKKSSPELQRAYFGYGAQDKRGMPTNGEFLFALYERQRQLLFADRGREDFFRCLEKVRSRSGCRLFLEEEPSSPSSGQKALLP